VILSFRNVVCHADWFYNIICRIYQSVQKNRWNDWCFLSFTKDRDILRNGKDMALRTFKAKMNSSYACYVLVECIKPSIWWDNIYPASLFSWIWLFSWLPNQYLRKNIVSMQYRATDRLVSSGEHLSFRYYSCTYAQFFVESTKRTLFSTTETDIRNVLPFDDCFNWSNIPCIRDTCAASCVYKAFGLIILEYDLW
jgi:hypothetical protein